MYYKLNQTPDIPHTGQERVATGGYKSLSIIYIANVNGNIQIVSAAHILLLFSPKPVISSMVLQLQPGYSMTVCNLGNKRATLKVFPYPFSTQEFNLGSSYIKHY